jgi:ribosomal-protein-alanine N-acetyltransferase
MIFRTPIKTPRLTLRNESVIDFSRFYSMTIDPEVMKYIGDGSVFHWTEKVAFEKYKERVLNQKNQDLGNLAVYREDLNQYIGWCCIAESKFLGKIELSYRFCRDSWSSGFATESASAILIEAFQVADIDQVFACTHPENFASIAILKKIGFGFSHQKLSKPINREIPVFKINRGCLQTPG